MDAPAPDRQSAKGKASGTVLREACLVAAIGAVLAFAANAISPRGLQLTRNYFLTGTDEFTTNRPVPLTATNAGTNAPAAVDDSATAPALISVPRLDAKGLQAIAGAQALKFFQEARRATNRLIFVDARGDDDYQRGHIPGAYQLNPYDPDKYLPALLPVCQAAELIVVYCTGNECEDSELSALLLRKAGIPNQKLFVYVNGITEWMTNLNPLETGSRDDGKAGDAHP